MQRSIALSAVSAVTAASLALSAMPARSQSGRQAGGAVAYPDPASEDPITPPVGRPLSIDEAIAVGLQNNLDVQVNRYAPYESQLDAEGAWGAFDPLLSAGGNFFKNNPAPQAGSIINRQENTGRADVGIDSLLPYVGASFGIDFTGDWSEIQGVAQNPQISGFIPLNPSYQSSLGFTGNIPLMKGLIWNEPWTQVKTTKLAYGASLDAFTTSVMNTVQGIITSYWELVATKEQERVAEKSLESTRALLDQTETQYEVGVVSRVEVVQAEAGVANAEFQLIVAQNNYRNAQDNLIAAVLGDRLRADTDLLFNPTDNPDFESVQPVDLNQAVATAFAKRPELAAAEKTIQQGEVQLRFAKNQRLPQLDVVGSFTTLGAAGTPSGEPANPPTDADWQRFTDKSRTFGDSVGNWFSGAYDARIGAQLTIPLPNTTARKNVTKTQIQLRRANSEVARLKQDIIVELRIAARGLLASARGVEAAERFRVAAAEQLRAERIRLEHGESTPFDVLQRETDLVDAESQKIAALQAFRLSQVTLQRQQGTILEDRNVSIAGVRQLEAH